MDDLKEYLNRRIKHAMKRVEQIKKAQGDTPEKTHNYFGGQTLGYWQGKLSAYENALDEIESLED